jgi:hypothetical protein
VSVSIDIIVSVLLNDYKDRFLPFVKNIYVLVYVEFIFLKKTHKYIFLEIFYN